MGEIVRTITSDGMVMAYDITGTDIVRRAQEIHHTAPTATAALGRTLLAASLMGNQLKGDDNSLTLQVRGDGPLGGITCVSDSAGNVRGFVNNPDADVPRKYEGKLDVGAAVGTEGTLTVIRDLKMKEPYVGSVALLSGEIADDLAAYFVESEQIPSACGLGVLVDRDQSVRAAGGYLIQLLPGAGEDVISRVEGGVLAAGAVTKLLEGNDDPEKMLRTILSDFDVEILGTSPIAYRCDCSRDRMRRALLSLGPQELRTILESDGQADLSCRFCGSHQLFDRKELEELLKIAREKRSEKK